LHSNLFVYKIVAALCFALAIAFKNAKAYDDAIASYMKQADVQKQTGSYSFCWTNMCNGMWRFLSPLLL